MPLIISGQPKRERTGEKVLRPVRVPKGPEVEYRNSLLALNRLLKAQTAQISSAIKNGATPTEVRLQIEAALREANARFNVAAAQISPSTINRLNRMNKDRVERSLRQALGVDTAQILDTPEILQKVEIATAENVSLIKTIPEQHFAKVAQSVFMNFNGEKFEEGSLANRLKKLGNITDNRARLIARDQTASFISNINQVRQIDAGIEEYVWRNSDDIRVTGAPGGPNKPTRLHGNHWVREGKTFRWDKPPADGHPGTAIQCRCFPEPKVNIKKINEKSIKL